ncbi:MULTISPECIES: hypothetical protein [Pectobacterium]|uniref:hypothetical protein n=1 Tax=Pectobacterium TaxID=122277 RepID=UPI001C69BD8C|nr:MULTISPECIES: hypothetical protein [Pectobacterium]UXJ98722.1 hypothetical protein N5056_12860 [Pectobacterium aroidearum]
MRHDRAPVARTELPGTVESTAQHSNQGSRAAQAASVLARTALDGGTPGRYCTAEFPQWNATGR